MEIPVTRLANRTGPNVETASEDGHAEKVFGKLFGDLFRLVDLIPEVATKEQECLSRIESLLTEETERLKRVEGLAEQEGQSLETLKRENGKLAVRLAHLSDVQEVQDHNLEQVRLLCESVARQVERLSGDFIERQAKEPLFRELVRLYGLLVSLSENEKAELSEEILTITKDLVRFLDSQGIQIIQARQGEKLNPQEHQPIAREATCLSSLHGQVAKTYQPGFATSERVIQCARVSVFLYETSKKLEHREEKEGESHDNDSSEQ